MTGMRSVLYQMFLELFIAVKMWSIVQWRSITGG